MTTNADISSTIGSENQLTLTFSGRLDARGVAAIWDSAAALVEKTDSLKLCLNLDKVDYLDTAGAALIVYLKTFWESGHKQKAALVGVSDEFKKRIQTADEVSKNQPLLNDPRKQNSFTATLGMGFSEHLKEAYDFLTFSGELIWALWMALLHPKRIRWRDALLAAERSGVDALGIVALISFIVGLVMAFQAAIPMQMFGAEIYVANLIGVAMIRELGPLMTAIILAGRSGSSFAAEIGTMKINEEIDALITMGLNPVQFIMVPRVLAAIFITPLLTLFSNLVGIIGGSVVLISMGYPMITYYNKVVSFVSLGDLASGMVKCFVFGILIAATGCIRGFQTKSGPSAVGISTTRAVVTGIILIAVFDGIFSILYYCLGI